MATPVATYINITDLYLSEGQGFTLTPNNDIQTVTDEDAIANDAIRCVLVRRGSWDIDRNFGSELYTLLETKTPTQVSNDELYDIVADALGPMLQNNRVQSVDEVSIVQANRKTLTMKILLTINGSRFSTELTTSI